jgi:chloramphenicol 3-O-phosphotransferase
MELIALTGAPCSGKTTVARELEKRGYLFIDFCDLIKQIAADVLTHAGVPTTVEMIRSNKDHYREFLQVLGEQIGFNDNPAYVYRALSEYGFSGCAHKYAVFDNVRTPEQFAVLQGLGFHLVRIWVPTETRAERAWSKYGTEPEDFLNQGMHPIEKGTGLEPEIEIDGTMSPAVLVGWLVDLRIDTAA